MRKFVPILFLFACFAVIQSSYAQNSDDDIKELKKRYPILMNTYGDRLQNLDVEYIVAIDLSRSMNDPIPNGGTTYFNEVKRGIIQFLNAIPDNSKISIIGFGTTVRMVAIPTLINANSRTSIGHLINELQANEGYTDLKGACNLLIEGCSSTSTMKYLFTFTDFNNDPHSSSPFLSTRWETLQEKYALISKNSLIESFALKLPIDASSGRDLPSVRIVFPGLNVIEFDAASLQNWFSDRSSKLMEQNLWTFVSKDLQKLQSISAFDLKTEFGINGQVEVTGKFNSLPGFVKGLRFTEVGNVKISGGNRFKFSPNGITSLKPTCEVGHIEFNESINPFSSDNLFKGAIKAKIITPASDEIERLFAVVSLHQSSGADAKGQKSAESLLTYTQEVHAGTGFLITWPLWLFLLVVTFVLILFFLALKNSILPYKLNGYAFKIDGGNLIKLEGRYNYIVSTQKGDAILPIPGNLEFIIYGSKGDPFNALIKKALSIKIVKGKPNVKIGGVICKTKGKYRMPYSKTVLISEGLAQVKLEFFRIK